MQLQDKHVVVTGGGTGIGLAISKELKRAGARVTICGRRQETLAAAANEHGFGHAVLDVTDDASVTAFAAQHTDVDILVNNAGIMNRTSIRADDAVQIAEAEFATNVIGPIRLTHALLPTLLERDGAVVNVTSGLAYIPWPSAATYCATKAAMHSWTHSVRHQVPDIQFFEVLPPLTDTPMVADVDIGMRKAQPSEVAQALVRGVKSNKLEIPVGMSKALRTMRRVAPMVVEKRLAKAV